MCIRDSTWASRAILRLQQQRYKDAEADFDHAIRLSTRNSGVYILSLIHIYPTHMILQFSSSHGGAFIGSPGNTLWVTM